MKYIKTPLLFILFLIIVRLDSNAQSFVAFKNTNSSKLNFGFTSVRRERQSIYHQVADSSKPRIRLQYSYTLNNDGKSHTRHYEFRVNNGELNNLGLCNWKIKPYLSVDQEANKFLKKSSRQRGGSWFFIALTVGSCIGFITTYNNTDVQSIPIGVVCCTSFVATLVLSHFSNKNIQKSVCMYNQNAGYGYKCGLEKTNTIQYQR